MQPEQTILKCSTDATCLNFLLPSRTTNCANVATMCNLLTAVGSANSNFPNRWPKEVKTMTRTPTFGISGGRCFGQFFYIYIYVVAYI